MTIVGQFSDWLLHPDSSPYLTGTMTAGGGPLGGIGNKLSYDLTETSALRRSAYVNQRLGSFRGNALCAMSVRFASGTSTTKVALLTRWSSAILTASDLAYCVEFENEDDQIRFRLRLGPGEDGALITTGLLDSDYGFAPALWMETALALDVDTVGNQKLIALGRSNGPVSGHTTFAITDTSWYRLGGVTIPRHLKRDRGAVGWQVLTRASTGTVDIGHAAVTAAAAGAYTILTDDVVL